MRSRRSPFVVLASALLACAAARARAECCAPRAVAAHEWPAPAGTDVAYVLHVHADGVRVQAVLQQPPSLLLLVTEDDGETFAPPVDLGATAARFGCDVAFREDGDFVVAWGDGSELRSRVVHGGGRRLDPIVVHAPIENPAFFEGIDVSREGDTVALAWSSEGARGTAGVHATVSRDFGRTWTPRVRLADPGERCHVATSCATSEIVVAWTDRPSGAAWSRTTRDGGLGFARAVRIDGITSGGAGAYVELTHTSGSHHQAAVRDVGVFLSTDLSVSETSDGGDAWTRTFRLAAGHPMAHAIEANQDGRVVLLTSDTPSTVHLRVSPAHATAGTWAAPVLVASGCRNPEPQGTLELPDGTLLLEHDDYRDQPSCPDPSATCESAYVRRSCTGGATWESDGTRLDDDSGAVYTHSENGRLVVSATGRIHAFWNDLATVVPYDAIVHHAVLIVPRSPVVHLEASREPGDPCPVERTRLRLVVDDPGNCAIDRVSWTEDGAPLGGASGWEYLVPDDEPVGSHSFVATVGCAEGCGSVTPPLSVDVPAPVGRVGGVEIDGLLHVTRIDAATLRLHVTDANGDALAHSAYEGRIGAWYSHSAVACRGVPLVFDVPLPSLDAYYLVTPADCGSEGDAGRDSFGRLDPTSPGGPACGPVR